MNINTIAGQADYKKTANRAESRKEQAGNTSSKQTKEKEFYESLSDSMYGQEAESDIGQSKNAKTTIVDRSYQYRSVTSAIRIQNNGMVNAKAVVECGARNITYAQSDYVKTYVEQGFAFKAQVDITGHCIYIEEKRDDGTVKGYEVDYGKLEKDTENPIEQMALEAWEMANRSLQGDTPFFQKIKPEELLPDGNAEGENDEKEALHSFYDFVQDRIKNGPPKYLIGASEFSVEEWEKFLDGIDGQMDEIREQMREEIAKRIEEAEKKEAGQETAMQEVEAQEGLKEETEEEKLEKMIQTLFAK